MGIKIFMPIRKVYQRVILRAKPEGSRPRFFASLRMTAPHLVPLLLLYELPSFAITAGQKFPEVVIEHHRQGLFNSRHLSNKVTVINFWATWCEACKVELKEMQQQFKALFTDQRFQFLLVSLDKDPESARQWAKANLASDDSGMLKYLYKDPTFKIADELNVDSFPMTLVIDQQSRVHYIQKGFQEKQQMTEKLLKIVQSLLDKTKL